MQLRENGDSFPSRNLDELRGARGDKGPSNQKVNIRYVYSISYRDGGLLLGERFCEEILAQSEPLVKLQLQIWY